jgi:hypothetical protein
VGGNGGGGGTTGGAGTNGTAPGGGGGGGGEDASGGTGAAGRVQLVYAAAGGNPGLIDIDGTDYIEISSEAINPVSIPSAVVWVDGVKGATAVLAGVWHHVVITTSGVNASNADIGRVAGGYFDGVIDDVRFYSRVLPDDQIKRLYNLGGTFTINTTNEASYLNRPESGLVGWWTFDGPDGLMGGPSFGYLTAPDMSGNGNKGVQNTAANIPKPIAGPLGQALEFDGVDDFVNIGDVGILDGTDFTLHARIYPHDLSADEGTIVSKWNADLGRYSWRVGNDGSLWFLQSEGGGCNAGLTNICEKRTAANAIPSRQWTQVVAVYNRNANDMVFYINGTLISLDLDEDFLNPLASTADALTFGRRGDANDEFNGLIDDIRIYNRALTEEEIKRLYNLGR